MGLKLQPVHWKQFKVISLKLIVALGLCTFPAYADDGKPCEGAFITDYLGTYRIVEVIEVRGGFRTKQEAKALIGSKVQVNKEIYSRPNRIFNNPGYQLKCWPITKEGEVPHHRWINFHYYEPKEDKRTVIQVIEVYDLDRKENRPFLFIEPVNTQLWYIYGGWLHKMDKIEE